MKNKLRSILLLVGSLLLLSLGMFQMLTDVLSSMSMFVASIIAISGFIGVMANGLLILKEAEE